MRIKAKLYGTLSQLFPGYRHSEGMELDIPDGATVKELLELLEIPESQKAMLTMEGRIQKPDDVIQPGAQVHIFNPIHGG